MQHSRDRQRSCFVRRSDRGPSRTRTIRPQIPGNASVRARRRRCGHSAYRRGELAFPVSTRVRGRCVALRSNRRHTGSRASSNRRKRACHDRHVQRACERRAESAQWFCYAAVKIGNGGRVVAFHGYYIHRVTAASKSPAMSAPGQKSGTTSGFTYVAYPAEYRVTGVMTFAIARDGTVYESDLGANTVDVAKKISGLDSSPAAPRRRAVTRMNQGAPQNETPGLSARLLRDLYPRLASRLAPLFASHRPFCNV